MIPFPSAMRRRLVLQIVACIAVFTTPTLALAQNDVSLVITPNRTEARKGDQVCFTLPLLNTTAKSLPGLSLNLFSQASDINFFLTSQGGEIHPSYTFWTVSLSPHQTMLIKARSQILTDSPDHAIRVLLSIGGQGYTIGNTAADIHILRRLPAAGVNAKFFQPIQ
jgi:hypothetical protein